jgi:superfamily II DNA or RNA helicase
MMDARSEIQIAALKAIGRSRKSGIEVSMGVGKTLIGLQHMSSIYTDIRKYLVVAPKKSIFTSWIDDMGKFNMTHLIPRITFTTYRSLPKHDLDYDVVYLDECHSLKETHASWLKAYEKSGGCIVGLTGTYPDKVSTEKGKMCNYFCPKVFEYKTDNAVGDKILNDYEIIIHRLKLNHTPTLEREGKYGKYKTSEVKEYNYWTFKLENANDPKSLQICRIQRMKALQSFKSKQDCVMKLLGNTTDKTIVFANTKKQADEICEYSYHSSNSESDNNLKMFKNGDILELSAVEQLSEGVTIPNLKVGIIMHAYANNRKAAQKIGRLLRLNPNDKSTIHILCYVDTVDIDWVTSALKDFDQNKISWK